MHTDLILGLWRCLLILAGIALVGGILVWVGEHYPEAVDKQIKKMEAKSKWD
ncbi:MAG: hypothetical protein AAGU74_08450 [Bacillota bacterium]